MNVNDQTFAAFAGANEERKKSLLQYVSEGANNADLEAAGYTPAEVAAAFSPTKSGVTSKELDRDRQGISQNNLESYSPTYRDSIRGGIEQGAAALGVSKSNAKFLANRVAGSGGEMGLLDLTGVGAITGGQEAAHQIERGYKTGSKTDMALGALGLGGALLTAVPGGKLVEKGITKGAEKLTSKFLTREAEQTAPEVIQAAEVASRMPEVTPEIPKIPEAVDQTTAALGAAPKPKKQVSPKDVVVPTYKPVVAPNLNVPNVEFGSRKIRDIFPSDDDNITSFPTSPGEVDWTLPEELQPSYNPDVLGYSRNINMDDLARIKLGRDTPENVLEQYGNDVTPETLGYLDSRLKGLEDNPDFKDYTEKLKANPYFNFHKALDDLSNKSSSGSKVTFRSPIPEFLDVIDFPKKGMEGSQLLSALRSNPTIRKSELDSVLPEIDPKARYTREEAKSLLEDNLWDVRVNENKDFEQYQRQTDLSDPEIEYKEFTVDARRPMGSTFAANKKHFSPETLAHTRVSLREDAATGKVYALAEELQTDLLQGGYKASQAGSERFTPSDAVESLRANLKDDYGLNDLESNLLAVRAGQQGDWKYDYGQQTKDLRKAIRTLPEYKNAGNVAVDSYARELTQTGTPFENLLADSLKISPDDFFLNPDSEKMNNYHDLKDRLNDIYYEKIQPKLVYESQDAISQPPIKTNKEAVRLLVGTLIAKAAPDGISTIVFPPIERIVEKRFYRDSGEYTKALTPGSGFYQTYVTDLQSVLKDLQKEFGPDKFTISTKDLNYTTAPAVDAAGNPLPDLPTTGIAVDFSGLLNSGVDLSKMRFAQGGLVGYAEGGDVGKAIKDNPIWQHHMSNVEGGKTVKNKDGSVSTVRTLIMGDGQYEYLIPTVWDGKILSDEEAWGKAMSSGINWPKAPAGEEGVKSLEHLDQQLHKNMTPTGFAQGGTVEDEQMNRLMQDGGMADAGVAQEPVTGNEVPPGALPSEVRDDVPAQLSEGEYVVPADVLRFFGMRFFEDLRNQAKQGLAEMQSNGRIGGATVDSNGIPAPSEQEDQLSPEEEQMLNEALGKTGMAEGGVVPFDRTTFSLNNATTGTETRKYIDPTTGVTQDFQFVLGSPSSPIPANFVPWTQDVADAVGKPKAPTIPVTTPVAPLDNGFPGGGASERGYEPTGGSTTTGGGTGVSGGFNYDNWAKENYADITSNPYQFGVDALTDQTGKYASKGLGAYGLLSGNLPVAAVGMGVKAYNKIQNIAEANAALQVMKAQGLESSTDYKNLQKTIGIAIDALPPAQQLLVEKHMVATGDKYVKSIEDVSKTPTATTTPTPAPVVPAAAKTGTQQGSIGTVTGSGSGGAADRDRQGSTVAPTKNATGSISASAGQPSVKSTTTPTKAQVAQYTSSNATTPTKTSDSGPKKGAAGRATGGLITKPQKTAPKTKGLAGKQ